MKIGIIGAGAVGAATIGALLHSHLTVELIVIDIDERRAIGVATDYTIAASLDSTSTVRVGSYDELVHADVVIVTAGINEKTGGATDRSDPRGRLLLIPANARIYADIIPKIVSAAPGALLLIVTDPPDPLADLTRDLAGHDRVLSTGTIIDSLRFRYHLSRTLDVSPASVHASVYGEHGTSAVYGWSTASIAGTTLADIFAAKRNDINDIRVDIQTRVREGNIAVIEGTGASQYAIGAVVARIIRAIDTNERAVLPIGIHHPEYSVFLGAPAILGTAGIHEILPLSLDTTEKALLEKSATVLRHAHKEARTAAGF